VADWSVAVSACTVASPIVQLFTSVNNGSSDGRVMRCGIISSCHYRDCKELLDMSLSRVSSTSSRLPVLDLYVIAFQG